MHDPALVARLRYTVDGDGCWLFGGYIKPNGYGAMTVRSIQAEGPMSAHVVSWIAHNGPVPAGMDVDHECHNRDATCAGGWTCKHRRCINPEHLRITDRSSNLAAGRGRSKLTQPQVDEIRRQIALGATNGDLAQQYGVTADNIGLIRHYKTWR